MNDLDDVTIRKLALGEFTWNEAALVVYEGKKSDEIARQLRDLINKVDGEQERQRLSDRYHFVTHLAQKYGRLYQILRDNGRDVNVASYFVQIPPPEYWAKQTES